MNAIKLFLRWTKGNKWMLVIALLTLIILNYIRSNIPFLISQTYAIIDPNGSSNLPVFLTDFLAQHALAGRLFFMSIIVFSFIVLRDLINLFYDFIMSLTSESIGMRVQTNFYDHIQKLPYSYLNQAQTGDLIQRSTSDINRFKRFIGGVMPNMLNNFFLIGFYFYQMMRVDVQFALISISLAPLLFIFSFFYFKWVAKDFQELEEKEGQLTSVAQENITGIRVVKAFANEKYEIKKFDDSVEDFSTTWQRLMKKISFFWGFSDGVIFFQLLASFLISIYFYRQGITIDAIILIFMCIQDILWRTRSLGRQLSEFTRTSIAAKRILEIMDEKTEYELANGTEKPKIFGTIEFNNVSFSFDDASVPTLHNISLKINAGETIAIVGKTGSGKSTLINLINRMFEVSEGAILIDGTDIKNIEKQYLRRNIGICMQEPFLFSKTVKENIGILINNVEENKVREVARIASIETEIDKFKDGYDTLVGERGVTLSGGQKQRIAIARILTEEKPILIFDDSLSAVDTETDKQIRKGLLERKNKATTIIVTHKILSAMTADKIVVLEDGKISVVGTHEELIEKEGLYKNIYKIQNYFTEGGETNG
ncbi:MAG: ABC transporter ATP-binding protein/permease [Erysipelotrichales bacterium]|nr:ABC transporter ATP-binding protein/permease [Erysipelotrichales bacterium]